MNDVSVQRLLEIPADEGFDIGFRRTRVQARLDQVEARLVEREPAPW